MVHFENLGPEFVTPRVEFGVSFLNSECVFFCIRSELFAFGVSLFEFGVSLFEFGVSLFEFGVSL